PRSHRILDHHQQGQNIAAASLCVALLSGTLPSFPAVHVDDVFLGGAMRAFAQVLLSADLWIGASVLLAALITAPAAAAAAAGVSALLSLAWLAAGLDASTEAAG